MYVGICVCELCNVCCVDRARSQAGQLQDQLIQEQNANKWLRGQLDRAHKELQVWLWRTTTAYSCMVC